MHIKTRIAPPVATIPGTKARCVLIFPPRGSNFPSVGPRMDSVVSWSPYTPMVQGNGTLSLNRQSAHGLPRIGRRFGGRSGERGTGSSRRIRSPRRSRFSTGRRRSCASERFPRCVSAAGKRDGGVSPGRIRGAKRLGDARTECLGATRAAWGHFVALVSGSETTAGAPHLFGPNSSREPPSLRRRVGLRSAPAPVVIRETHSRHAAQRIRRREGQRRAFSTARASCGSSTRIRDETAPVSRGHLFTFRAVRKLPRTRRQSTVPPAPRKRIRRT